LDDWQVNLARVESAESRIRRKNIGKSHSPHIRELYIPEEGVGTNFRSREWWRV
jgi:hypothetical protein